MTHLLFEHSTGIYLFSDMKLISHLPLTIKQNLDFIQLINSSKPSPDLLNFLSILPPNSDLIVDKSLFSTIKKLNLNAINDIEAMRSIRNNFSKITKNEDNRSVFGLSHLFSREKVNYDIAKEDNFVIQSFEMIELLQSDIDRYGKKLREMYGYHFPELNYIKEEYFTVVSVILNRKENLQEKINKLKENNLLKEFNFEEIKEKAEMSIGSEISDIDLEHIKQISELLINKNNELKESLFYLEEKIKQLSPNLTALLGVKLSARIICKAGGLYNLAKCPSSTLQLLGAEKALFRALKAKSNTPKFGVLFERVKKLDEKDRARVARFLASKCSIAARIDCFSEERHDEYGKALEELLVKKIEGLKENKRVENTDSVLKKVFDKLREKNEIKNEINKESKKAKNKELKKGKNKEEKESKKVEKKKESKNELKNEKKFLGEEKKEKNSNDSKKKEKKFY
ncbi:snoRNP complex protein nop56 [Gurleya vavrai]